MQNKILKLQAYDLSLFVGQSFFFNDGAQNYLIFRPLYEVSNTNKIAAWKSRCLLLESIVAPNAPNFDYNIYPRINWCVNSTF